MTSPFDGVEIFPVMKVINVMAQATDESEPQTDLELLQTARARVGWRGEYLFGMVRRAVEQAAIAKSLRCHP
jgi:hypothetical protein